MRPKTGAAIASKKAVAEVIQAHATDPPSGITAVVSVDDGKASIVVGVTDDLVDRVSAVDLVRVGSSALGGKGGGGRPDMAQAGGPDGSEAQAAVDAIGEAIEGAAN